MHYLEMQVWENSEILEVDVVLVDWFYSQPPEMKICILTGLQHYLKLFGLWDTWFLLFENLIAYTSCFNCGDLFRCSLWNNFSSSFTVTTFVKDLKLIKRLLSSSFTGEFLYSYLW